MQNVKIKLIPVNEFRRIESAGLEKNRMLSLVADMCRANALAVVKRAGSGHLGSTFSSMDLFVRLYYDVLNVREVGVDALERDIFFSSKGHDCPGLYTVLNSLGIVETNALVNLRRMDGLEGHPDVRTPGVEANSGSLGMGISKARGMAWTKQIKGYGGNVYVLTGDGEFQEGQNYEALQGAAHGRCRKLTVIMDHNKVQSDKYVDSILSLGNFEAKIESFGWHVLRCDGNSQESLGMTFSRRQAMDDCPVFIIADTIKGKGVSFMEHPVSMQGASTDIYPWHAGAPGDEHYVAAQAELKARISRELQNAGVDELRYDTVLPPASHDPVYSLDGEQVSIAVEQVSKQNCESIAAVYGEALLEAARTCPDLVVLDADLAADCRVREFEKRYPDRFIECGIAEQDMVSMAGGLARLGLLPVVNSFASFLASRANEQIYNNATELTKIIYACHYAGLIPAGPGKSHQSIRDISLFGALPNCEIIQPCCGKEMRQAVDYAVAAASENVVLRMPIGPSPRTISLPDGYRLEKGKGALLRDGREVLLIAYGPVLLHETLVAAVLLSRIGVSVRVVSMPWLNRFDTAWWAQTMDSCGLIFIIEDHSPVGGLSDRFVAEMLDAGLVQDRKLYVRGVSGYPVFGTPWEALKHHRLDGASLAAWVRELNV